MAIITIAPFLAAYTLYHFWRPSSTTNYGQLVAPPVAVGDLAARSADGSEFKLKALRGRWLFLMIDSGACDAYCEKKLYQMRQIRLTQGKDMERIERVWLLDDEIAPTDAVTAEFVGTHQLRAAGSALLQRLPAGTVLRDHIFLVDPIGNLMMRYPRDADPSRIKKDITKLLRVSQMG